jgi:hypothetical protein
MRDLERFVERGICYGGGVPQFFGIPGSATVSPWGIWECAILWHRAN